MIPLRQLVYSALEDLCEKQAKAIVENWHDPRDDRCIFCDAEAQWENGEWHHPANRVCPFLLSDEYLKQKRAEL